MEKTQRFAQDREFSKRQIAENVWHISGSKGCDSYVVIGTARAAVIDTGENRRNLRVYVESITNLPLLVLNTHGHFDHTGANGKFKDCPIYMAPFACRHCKDPHNYLNPEDYDLDYTPTPITEGQSIDLGDILLEAFEVPCHSPGSLAFLERKSRMIFTGDEVETGQVLIYGDMRKLCSVERYFGNMQKLKQLQNEYDYVCPAHNGSPAYKTIIDDYIVCCEKILSGEEGGKKLSSPSWLSPQDPRTDEDKAKILNNPLNRRMEYRGASLVYSLNHRFVSQENPLDE